MLTLPAHARGSTCRPLSCDISVLISLLQASKVVEDSLLILSSLGEAQKVQVLAGVFRRCPVGALLQLIQRGLEPSALEGDAEMALSAMAIVSDILRQPCTDAEDGRAVILIASSLFAILQVPNTQSLSFTIPFTDACFNHVYISQPLVTTISTVIAPSQSLISICRFHVAVCVAILDSRVSSEGCRFISPRHGPRRTVCPIFSPH